VFNVLFAASIEKTSLHVITVPAMLALLSLTLFSLIRVERLEL